MDIFNADLYVILCGSKALKTYNTPKYIFKITKPTRLTVRGAIAVVSTVISPLIGWTGAATLVLAPFGAFALNLAAIAAAICMGREAHEDPAKRYVAAVAAGVFYIAIGLFGATVGAVFAALPKELVQAIAGLALLGTIGNGLAAALSHEREREPALVTFLVTASGLTLFGIGSAFSGLVAGALSLTVLQASRRHV